MRNTSLAMMFFLLKWIEKPFNLNKSSLENIFSNDREFTLFLKSLDDKMAQASKKPAI